MSSQSHHYLGISIFYTAEVTAKTILVKLFPRLAVPKATGIGADLIGKNNSPVGQSAELEFEVNEDDSAFFPVRLKIIVYSKSVLLDGSVPSFIAPRRMSPVAIAGMLYFSEILADCVPLPAPGAPNNISFILFLR